MARKKIGDLLVEQGLITPVELEQSLHLQTSTGKRLGAILVEQGKLTEEQLVDIIASRLLIPKISLDQLVIDPSVVQRVPVDLARRYTLIPVFAMGNTLTLAMADPLNIIALDEIKYFTKADVKRAVATSREIKQAIDQYYSVTDSLNQIIGARREPSLAVRETPDVETATEPESPIVKLVNLIIAKAVRDRASDIHLEPDENSLRIRYRINGVMREEGAPPKSMQNEMISRIKIAADLDVSEKRLPQDGRFIMRVDGNPIDLRISTLPTIHGEKIVIRVLDRRNLLLTFRQLGFGSDMAGRWQSLVRKPEGLILITGPTSSGKTSTLYTTLNDINSTDKNIITVEDPVEYSLPLINQIQINEKAGLSFPSCLRAILRQSPDVIMIGEVRDTETARIAVRSALTGHLVFSTTHTNNAPQAISRLTDMGIEPYLLTAALKGVLAQRLVRTNCPHCLTGYQPSETVLGRAGLLDSAHHFGFKKGAGCKQCKGTGLAGLTGIFELVEVTPALGELIIKNASPRIIGETARRAGYIPLFEAGLDRVKAGEICLEELLKETSSVPDDAIDRFGGRETIHAGAV
ncbi:MAG: Flp pilus assembly complex ATPase component TadA [candidate division Zixibacteria bacterium]|nr:Flp pilus assembly complex ATPase component TadA [candidate division Zixibacteria bacterium]